MNIPSSFFSQRAAEKGQDKIPGVSDALMSTMEARDAVNAKRADLQKNAGLSPQGRTKEVRNAMGRSVAAIARESRQAVQNKAALKKQRAELRPPSNLDKNSVYSVSIQLARGQKLAAMNPVQRKAFLSSKGADPQLVAAALDLPPDLTGFSAEDLVEIEDSYVKQNHARDLARISHEMDAWDLVEQAITAANAAVYRAGGFSNQQEFQQFVAAHDKAADSAHSDIIAGFKNTYSR